MAKNTEKTGGVVGPVLLAILATVGISAGGYGAGIGAAILRYEVIGPPFEIQEKAQSGAAEEDRPVVLGSTIGPTVRVDSGVVTWRIEDEHPSGLPPVQAPATAPQEGQAPTSAPTQDPAQSQPPAQSQASAQRQDTTPATKNNTNSASSGSTAKPATGNSNTSSGKPQTGVNINPSSQRTNAKPQGGNSQSGGNVNSGVSNQATKLDWPEGKYLASNATKKGGKYHCTYCQRGMAGAVNIKEENKIWFDSEEDARAAGYERCGICWG